MRIGVDLDNTIISYHELFHRQGVTKGWIPSDTPVCKQQVRDLLRKEGEEGELRWQRLQGEVYGPLMSQAEPFLGVHLFFELCGARRWPLYVISHKTEYSEMDPTRTPLREAALDWLSDQGFCPDGVDFGSTREEKIELILSRECTHFIDDLPEVLNHPQFPSSVRKIWFSPSGAKAGGEEFGLEPYRSWNSITELLSAEAE